MIISSAKWRWILLFLGGAIVLAIFINPVQSYLSAIRAGPEPLTTIKMATITYPGSVPLHVAQRQGYFAAEGVKVELVLFSSGRDGLSAVLDGQIDFCIVADIPVVLEILNGRSPAIVATIFSAERDHRVIARGDHAIATPADLKGKRIGVSAGTTSDLVLDLVLNAGKLSRDDVTVVPLKTENMQQKMVSGEIDAVSTWEPILDNILDALGPKAAVFDAFDVQGIFSIHLNLVVAKARAVNDPASVQKILRAIFRAEEFIRTNPEQAQRIATESSGLALDDVQRLWPGYRFEMRLDQSLLISLEDTARWAIRSRRMEGYAVPAFSNYIFPHELTRIDPGAVRLIR